MKDKGNRAVGAVLAPHEASSRVNGSASTSGDEQDSSLSPRKP